MPLTLTLKLCFVSLRIAKRKKREVLTLNYIKLIQKKWENICIN